MADDQITKQTEEQKSEPASETKLSSKLEKVVEELEKLTVLELSEVVSALQERWGVSPVAMAAPSSAMPAGEIESGTAPASGGLQTVVLTNAGGNKIAVIKALREINPNLGLKEAKDMSEKLPAEVVKDIKAEEAKLAQEKLTAAGATVEVK